MKKLLAIIIIGLCLTTPSQADDIREFTIDGMSIGDSALKFFTKSEIEKNTQNYPYKSKKMKAVWINNNDKTKTYNGIQFHHDTSDRNFKIESLSGVIWFIDDFSGCKKKQKEIVSEFKEMFPNEDKIDTGLRNYRSDPSNKSKFINIGFRLKSGDTIFVSCSDWSESMKPNADNLRVTINSAIFDNWINYEAY